MYFYTMILYKVLKSITSHPLNKRRRFKSIINFFKFQIGSILLPGDIIYNWVSNSKFIVKPGETGLTGNVYCGLHEFPDMGFILHYSRKEDFFIDIGSNVGSYTILVGKSSNCKGISIEPIPETYKRLIDNIKINDLDKKFDCLNIGLGNKNGTLSFTSNLNCTNHVKSSSDSNTNNITVEVKTLDSLTKKIGPSIIKIDVEGFETPVIDGGKKTFNQSSLKCVIMELNGSGERYGFDDNVILEKMKGFGFKTYSYNPFNRSFRKLDGKNQNSGNTIFIKDIEFVKNRVENSKKYNIHGFQL